MLLLAFRFARVKLIYVKYTQNTLTRVFLHSSAMDLPCAHQFAARTYFGHDQFEADLCGRRWHLQYYTSVHRAYQEPAAAAVDSVVNIAPERIPRALLETDKYRQAFDAAVALARNMSALGTVEFQHSMAALAAMADLLARG